MRLKRPDDPQPEMEASKELEVQLSPETFFDKVGSAWDGVTARRKQKGFVSIPVLFCDGPASLGGCHEPAWRMAVAQRHGKPPSGWPLPPPGG